MRQARYWKHDAKVKGRVACVLCPHECLIAEGKAGRCLGRRNIGGELVAASYGEIVSIAVDPIEKKPLYHFLPGSEILSVATYGCNLRCPFCQNAEISQQVTPSRHVEPDELLALARHHATPSLAYTYNEPCVWFEYLMDAGKLMQGAGIRQQGTGIGDPRAGKRGAGEGIERAAQKKRPDARAPAARPDREDDRGG